MHHPTVKFHHVREKLAPKFDEEEREEDVGEEEEEEDIDPLPFTPLLTLDVDKPDSLVNLESWALTSYLADGNNDGVETVPDKHGAKKKPKEPQAAEGGEDNDLEIVFEF